MSSLPHISHDSARRAQLLLVLLSFAWGLNWPAMRVALTEVSPWTLRFVGFALGSVFLFAVIALQHRNWRIPFGLQWGHIAVSAFLNAWLFGIFSSYAQIIANTSRVAFVAYSMPVWASLMAWLLLANASTPARSSDSCCAGPDWRC